MSVYDSSLDEEEEVDFYKAQYMEEHDDINFFKDLVLDTIDGLETMIFRQLILLI